MILPPGYVLISENRTAPVHIGSGWDVLCDCMQRYPMLHLTERSDPMCEACARELAMRIMEDRLHKPDPCADLGHDWQDNVCLRCGYDVS